MIKKLIFIMLFGLSIIVLGTFSIGCSVDKYSKGSCSEGDLQLRFSEKQALLCTKTIESKLVFIRDRNHTFNYEWSYARADIDAKTMKKFLIELGLGNFTYKVFYIRLFFPHRKIPFDSDPYRSGHPSDAFECKAAAVRGRACPDT